MLFNKILYCIGSNNNDVFNNDGNLFVGSNNKRSADANTDVNTDINVNSNNNAVGSISGDLINTNTNGDVQSLLLSF